MKKKVQQPIITEKEIKKVEEYFAKVEKEGYRPWVTVRQSHTIGQGQIIMSHKTNRTHHFLSRGESKPFYHFEADPEVTEIFDQFPLDINQTMKIADELNIVHPGSYIEADEYGGYKPAKTMTLDYVIKRGDGSQHAFNFKYADSLDPKLTSPVAVARTEAKAKIERAYCRKFNITWTQLTENSFNAGVTQNLKYLRECFDYENEINVGDDIKSVVLCQLKLAFERNPRLTVRDVLNRVSVESKFKLHQVQSLFQFFVYNKLIDFDWTTEIDLNRPLPQVEELEEYAG